MHRNALFHQDNFLVPTFGFDWPWLGPQSDYVKWCLALAGAILLLVLFRERLLRATRTQLIVLAVLASLSGLAYVNFLTFHGPRGHGYERVHPHDIFHYAMGSKYFPELGYASLYEASLVALKENSGDPDFFEDRFFREMEDYRLLRATELSDRDEQRIRALFTPERWRTFKEDTAVFRRLSGEANYNRLYVDHGYNPSPAYTMLARLFTEHTGFTRGWLEWLALGDPLLLAAGLAALAWAFGIRGALLVTILLFLCHPARWAWTGGSLLRTPWLAALCIGLALCHRRRPVAAGVLLGVAAAFRGFPGLVLVGLAAPFLWSVLDSWRTGKTSPRDWLAAPRARTCAWIVAAAAPTLLVLALVSPWVLQRPGVIGEWFGGIRAHASHIGLNSIGLKPALAFSPEATQRRIRATYQRDVLDHSTYGLRESDTPSLSAYYGEAKAGMVRERRVAYGLVVGAGWLLFAMAARRATPAQAVILGLSLIFFGGLNVASYYYGFIALFAVYYLAGEKPNLRAAYVMTAALLLLSVSDHWIAQVWDDHDVIFGLESIGRLVFLLGFLGLEAVRAFYPTGERPSAEA